MADIGAGCKTSGSSTDSDQSWLDDLDADYQNDKDVIIIQDETNLNHKKRRLPNRESELESVSEAARARESGSGDSESELVNKTRSGNKRKIQKPRGSDKSKRKQRIGKARGPYNLKRNEDSTGSTSSYSLIEKTRQPYELITRSGQGQQTRAQKIATKFKDNLSFLTCACCPFSGPQDLFMPIEEFRKTNLAALKYNGIRKTNRIEQLLSKSTEQANAFAFEFQNAFTEFGLLKGLEYLCKRCRGGLAGSCPGNGEPVDVASMFGDVISNTMKKKRRSRGLKMGNVGVLSEDDDDADDERDHLSNNESDMEEGDSENIEHELQPASTKKRGIGSLDNSYLNGLYPGDVPEVLKCLNNIELSVIAKINHDTITKVRLVGTSHYVAITPVYNIINNVLEIYERLPRMPSEIDFATLRTHNGKITGIKDYSFRPSMVIAALPVRLGWLKENNWLFRHYHRLSA